MQRGEIYFVDLDPIRGREQSGRRPVVIVSAEDVNSRQTVVTVVPGTDASHARGRSRYNVATTPSETGLPRATVFLCFQIRALDTMRFRDPPVGMMDSDRMDEIDQALRNLLDL